jgi:hypothetical protein
MENYEFPGLDKVVDEYGKEVWQKYIQTEECEDYYEIFPKIIIDGEKVDISLSVGKNWVIETADDKIAHKLNMMEVDRNFWSRVLTTEEFTEAQFEVVYKHLDDKLDKSVLMDVSAFLKLFYDM